jgi:hypothetical protein
MAKKKKTREVRCRLRVFRGDSADDFGMVGMEIGDLVGVETKIRS